MTRADRLVVLFAAASFCALMLVITLTHGGRPQPALASPWIEAAAAIELPVADTQAEQALLDDAREYASRRPRDASGQSAISVRLARLGKPREAFEAANRAIEIDPREWTGYVARALAELDLRRPEEALGDIHRAMALDPGQMCPYLVRAAMRNMSADAAGAVADAKRALQLEPGSYGAHVALGTAYSLAGSFPEAVEQCVAARRLRPASLDVSLCLASAYRGLNDAVRARKELSTALSLHPDPALRETLEGLLADRPPATASEEPIQPYSASPAPFSTIGELLRQNDMKVREAERIRKREEDMMNSPRY